MRLGGGAAIIVAAAACGSSENTIADAGTIFDRDASARDAVSVSIPLPPVPPAAPEAPRFDPCPPGWIANGVSCDPQPSRGCNPYELELPGESACIHVGRTCPLGQWPDQLPSGGTITYVDAAAAPGGSGTRAAPFKHIRDALAAAPAGSIIALAAATYVERVYVTTPVTIIGACVERTVLTSTIATTTEGTIDVAASGVRIESLSAGGRCPAIFAHGTGASIELVGVRVGGALGAGLALQGARATGHEVRISDIEGLGASVFGGGSLELDRALIDHNRTGAISVADPQSRLVLRDAIIRDTRPRAADGTLGRGINVDDGAEASLARVLIEQSRQLAAFSGTATTLALEDVILRDTLGQESDGLLGGGLIAREGANVTARRIVFERNRGIAVFAVSAGTRVLLEDAIVRDTRVELRGGDTARAIVAYDGARVELARAIVSGHIGTAIVARYEGTELALADLEVRETTPVAANGSGGWGLLVHEGAGLAIERARFDRNAGYAIALDDTLTRKEIRDLEVRDTSSDGRGLYGVGLAALGQELVLERARFVRNHAVAMVVSLSTSAVTASDLEIADTDSETAGGFFGRGLEVQKGARMTVERARFARNRDLSIFVWGPGGSLEASDLEVVETGPTRCTESKIECGFGIGVAAASSSTVSIERFRIADNHLCGAQVLPYGAMDLRDGTLARNPVGANVQSEGFDVHRILERVAFDGNDTDLDAINLPLPGEIRLVR